MAFQVNPSKQKNYSKLVVWNPFLFRDDKLILLKGVLHTSTFKLEGKESSTQYCIKIDKKP